MKNKGYQQNERNSKGSVKLPNLKSNYRKHPGEGMNFKKHLCGLCGSVHSPGQPHATKNASDFNIKTGKHGVARVGGGYIAPKDSARNS